MLLCKLFQSNLFISLPWLQSGVFVLSWKGYQSTSKTTPSKDPTPDYNLIKATEDNGYTNVQFDRDTTTDGDDKDVQFLVSIIF